GFTGFGTLGGGNATVLVGGNAGILTAPSGGNSTGLIVAGGSSGRVLSNGQLVETGGGELTLRLGGALNPSNAVSCRSGQSDNGQGTLTDLRGNLSVAAGAIGAVAMTYPTTNADDGGVGGLLVGSGSPFGGPLIEIGDGIASFSTRGDLVVGAVVDPGLVPYT